MSAPAAATDEARELSLVDKVELRIALADSDSKLETLLRTYLAPLLLKLGSQHLSVRNKVISVCQHVHTRSKSLNIALPVTALLKQLKEHSEVQLIRHFDLIFVQQGFSRLSKSEAAALFPTLINGIAATNKDIAPALLNLLLRSLQYFDIPRRGTQDDLDLRNSLGVHEADAEFLSAWLGKLLLLHASASERKAQRSPGLSRDEYRFLTLDGKDDVWQSSRATGLSLPEIKLKVGRLFSGGLFRPREKFLPALFASCEQDSELSTIGEDLLKHTIPEISFDSKSLITSLFNVYFGTLRGAEDMSSEGVSQAKPPLRMRILSLLSRSESSIDETDLILRVAKEDLVRENVNSGTASQGNREILKLRMAVMNYLMFVGRRGSQTQLAALAPSLIELLKLFLEYEVDDTRSPELKSLRGNTYQLIGVLSVSHKTSLAEPGLRLLRWFFQSLAEESDKDIVVSIDEAISTTIKSFQGGLTLEVENAMRILLSENMIRETKNPRNLRYATVRLANRCLKYSDVVARWIDISAAAKTANESYETVEEAKKGLDPYWFRLFSTSDVYLDQGADDTRTRFPAFSQLMHFIFKEQQSSGMNLEVLTLAISYSRQVLMQECMSSKGIQIEVNSEWERKLDLAVSEDVEGRHAVRSHLAQMLDDEFERESLSILWNACFQCLQPDSTQNRAKAIQVLLELCTLSPDPLIGHLSSKAFELDGPILANDMETRNAAAQAFGLLAAHPQCDEARLENSLARMLEIVVSWRNSMGAALNRVHGCILSLGFWISYNHYRQKNADRGAKVIAQVLPIIISMLDHSGDSLLQQGAHTVLGQLCMFNAITRNDLESISKLDDIVRKISKKAQDGNEKAILALGQIAMILDEGKDSGALKSLVEVLHKLHEQRQPETQFVVGEALACVACGWQSKALASKLPFDGPTPQSVARSDTLKELIDRTLADCATTKPSLKKASVIWLLCFVQFCGERFEIQERLRQFQAAFKRCLSDRDELVQESASRGLGLVYERGSREVKDDLVRDLVGSFSSNRADISGTVSEDTQLFEEGALPTGDGSIKTYKDIMSLASEVGDSTLVYRFMSLASNNAIWSSRAAFGKFGLSNVFSDASVDGYLAANPKLYPKLYRYRFDPNTNVRRSMNDIWNALVKDPTTTIDQYFEAIVEDLLDSIIGREWRVRQASCAAIADLIQGRKTEKIEPYLDRIWTSCFKVLDDIKDSVRVSALALARLLINILIRSLESSGGDSEAANKMLKSVLPFLMSTSGIESKSKEVKAVSITTLLDIIKKAQPKFLRSFVPELIENLIGLLSTLEPEEINYIHLNASKFNMTEQKIDELRLTGIRNSPLMETIDRCVDILDDEAMRALVPRLQSAMRNAVGMPSKVGCSRVIVSLCTRRTFLFRPYTDTVLKFVPKYISDRNDTVSGSYSAALGYVARGASDDAIIKLLEFAKGLYFESEDDKSRVRAGEIIQSIAKHATDRFAALAADFLPFVFVAKQDGVEQVKELFRTVWEDNVGGPRAAAMYLKEIMELASRHLSSRRWVLKHGAALSVAAAVKAISASKKSIDSTDGQLLWPALMLAMADKSWDGKELVLDGFVEFVKKGSDYWRSRKEVGQEITKITLREARRRNEAYRKHAVAALGQVAESRDDLDMCDEAYDILKPLIEELGNDYAASASDAEIGQGDRDSSRSLEESLAQCRAKTMAAAIDSLIQSLNIGQRGEARVSRALDLLLAVAVAVDASQPIAVMSALYANTTRLLERLTSSSFDYVSSSFSSSNTTTTTTNTATNPSATTTGTTAASPTSSAADISTAATQSSQCGPGDPSTATSSFAPSAAPVGQLAQTILSVFDSVDDPGARHNIQTKIVRLVLSGGTLDAMPETVHDARAMAIVTFARLLVRVRSIPAPPPLLLQRLPVYLSSEKSSVVRAKLQEALEILTSNQSA